MAKPCLLLILECDFMKFFGNKNKKFGSYYQENGFSVNTGDDFILVDGDIEEESQAENEPKKQSAAKELIDGLEVLTFAVVTVVIIFCLVFRVATIKGTSMLETLQNGDKVIISNINYEPKRGDIVVISRNVQNSADNESAEPIIKRVIATGGETVDIDFTTGEVKVDETVLDEDYISTPTTRSHDVEFPVYVPEGYIFVLGDNRDVSLDSRSSAIGENGLIDTRYVLGKAIFRIFPFDTIGGLYK